VFKQKGLPLQVLATISLFTFHVDQMMTSCDLYWLIRNVVAVVTEGEGRKIHLSSGKVANPGESTALSLPITFLLQNAGSSFFGLPFFFLLGFPPVDSTNRQMQFTKITVWFPCKH